MNKEGQSAKIFFLSADFGLYRDNIIDSRYHFGIAALISFMKKKGHQTTYCYFYDYAQMPKVLQFVKEYKPDVIACTVVESQWDHIQRIVKHLKKVANAPVICGGAFPTLCCEEICLCKDVDAVLIGEGEYAFAQFVDRILAGHSWHDVPNLAFYDMHSNVIRKNPQLPLIDDLDALPFPDRQFQSDSPFYDSYMKDESSRVGYDVAFIFARGCPFSCTYCCCSELAKINSQNKRVLPRTRSPLGCLEEVEAYLEKHSIIKPIMFMDDVFTINKEWLYPFLDGYRKRIRKRFACRTRIEIVDEDVFKALKSAGCYNIAMSVESGNDYLRNTVMKRNCSKEQIYKAFSLAHKHGIETSAPSLIGVPYETKETIEETIEVVAKTNSTRCYVGVFYPYKGTPLYSVCKEEGLLPTCSFNGRRRAEPVIQLQHLTSEDILKYYEDWEQKVIRKRSLIARWRFFFVRRVMSCVDRIKIPLKRLLQSIFRCSKKKHT